MFTRLTTVCSFIVFCAFATSVVADETVVDSLMRVHDSVMAASVPVVETKPRAPRFSFFDSVSHQFLSSRLNLRDRITAGIQKNPGDYLRSDPSQIVLTTNLTPVRTTVSPFGLSGDRFSAVVNGSEINPFEHIVQPDGAIDMNDVPRLADDNVYLLPGQAGRFFGGTHGVATLLTRPDMLADNQAHTAMLVNSGVFGYSNIRGRFHKNFTDGRNILLGIGYRDAEGDYLNTQDDSYHYLASVDWPFTSRWSISGRGNLYSREGAYPLAPGTDSTFQHINRDRFDRNAQIGLNVQNEAGTRRGEFGYTHRRQGSYLSSFYSAKFDEIAHGLYAALEGNRGSFLYRIAATGESEKWEDQNQSKDQVTGSFLASAFTQRSGFNFAFQAGTEYTEDFDMLPTATAMLSREAGKLYFLASIGYSQRAPSQHERFLRYRKVPFNSLEVDTYADSGNPDLHKEKQMVASVLADYGSATSGLQLNLTGGSIGDAIDWKRNVAIDSTGADTTALFSPINHDLTFASASVNLRQRVFKLITLTAGAAKFWYDSDSLSERLYRPEYNIFTGGEFHVHWSQTGVDLFAYGEYVYRGTYEGYVVNDMGDNGVVNTKVSLGIRRFRLFFVTENVFLSDYGDRELNQYFGRETHWGFTWQFTD